MTMIATAMRAAKEGGIALRIYDFIIRKSSNAIFDVSRWKKFQPPSSIILAVL
jgi:hypothetical protein